jgi:hypothetical protein
MGFTIDARNGLRRVNRKSHIENFGGVKNTTARNLRKSRAAGGWF